MSFDCDWLVKHLTNARAESVIWTEIAETIQEFWCELANEKEVDLRDSRLSFQSSDEGLIKLIGEMGSYFLMPDSLDTHTRRISVTARRWEIHRKSTTSAMGSIIRRNKGNYEIDWTPVYCKKGEAYDEANFATKDDIADPDDYWLTSRGSLGIVIVDKDEFAAITQEDIDLLSTIATLVEEVRPAHIVGTGSGVVAKLTNPVEPLRVASIARTTGVRFHTMTVTN